MVDIADIVARGQQFRLVREDRVLENFNGGEQFVMSRPAYWSFTIPILPRSNAEAKKWRASMVELSRLSNTFQATPPGYRGTQYARERPITTTNLTLSNGTSLELSNNTLLEIDTGFIVDSEPVFVDGAGQLGKSLNVEGADPNEILFRVGEYFSVNGELKSVTAECTTDSNGKAEVSFEPALRSPPANGLPVSMFRPTANFRLASNASWNLQPNRLHSFNLEAVESY
jgi:hypothetical protein